MGPHCGMCFLLCFTFLVLELWRWLVEFLKNVFSPSVGCGLDNKEINYNMSNYIKIKPGHGQPDMF
jgi:hypothetical protein